MLGNSYSEDQLMHTFLDNFEEGGNYSAQIVSHQVEMIRDEKFTDKKSLSDGPYELIIFHLGESYP